MESFTGWLFYFLGIAILVSFGIGIDFEVVHQPIHHANGVTTYHSLGGRILIDSFAATLLGFLGLIWTAVWIEELT